MLHKINEIFKQFLKRLYKGVFWVIDNEFKEQLSKILMSDPIWQTSFTKNFRISS